MIIDDVQRCCGSVLADFIIMLRHGCFFYFPDIHISPYLEFVLISLMIMYNRGVFTCVFCPFLNISNVIFLRIKILCPIEAYQVAIYREWVIKIPIILIVGVATLDALRNTLASNALQCLSPCWFTLGTPTERMDAVIEAVLLKHYHGFSIGKQVTTFLRNFFLRHDGTLTSFIRALKVSI